MIGLGKLANTHETGDATVLTHTNTCGFLKIHFDGSRCFMRD